MSEAGERRIIDLLTDLLTVAEILVAGQGTSKDRKVVAVTDRETSLVCKACGGRFIVRLDSRGTSRRTFCSACLKARLAENMRRNVAGADC